MNDTQGKLLVAPPKLPDWRFQKSVVYMWKHDVGGASGIIINKKCNHPDFKHVCDEGKIDRNLQVNHPVWYGGPILTNVIGVLHSLDFKLNTTNEVKDQIGYTLDRKILEVIARGHGPKDKMITLGMANWEPGQLEQEFNGTHPMGNHFSWLVLDYDPTLIFGPKPDDFWEMCVARAVENTTKKLTSKIFKD